MKMRRLWINRGIALAVTAGLAPVLAHHGTAASYDQTKSVTLKGTVTEFLWRNPHSALFLDVKQPDGSVVAYSIEMFSPSLMVKQGYKRTVLKKGDQVELDVHPSLAGTPSGECLGCRMLVGGKDPANDGAGRPKGKAKGKGK
jgi:hypothetical protein